MDNRKRIQSDDRLAELMWRDAQLTRPVFSAALDARLQAAIGAVVPLGPAGGVASRRKLLGNLLSWATAAAASIVLLVSSALVCHSLEQVPSRLIVHITPVQPAKPPADDIDSAADMVENTAIGLEEWMASTVDDNQWAGLDRDAETAMATVTGPLPFDLSVAIVAADPME
jgi:hypothetical protein